MDKADDITSNVLVDAGTVEFSSSDEDEDIGSTQASPYTVRTTKYKKHTEIRTPRYVARVHQILEDMGSGRISPEPVTSWRNKYDRLGGRAYQEPDPEYDAWMCIVREKRYAFPLKHFKKKYPNYTDLILNIRKTLGLFH